MKKILFLVLIFIISISMVSCSSGKSTVTENPQPVKSAAFPEFVTTGNTYYVSKTGNDSNSGTIDSPWLTFQKAVNTVKGGDTVYIRGGAYSQRLIITKSGASGAYITFAGYPGELAIIDGATFAASTSSGMIDIRNSAYIRIDGISVVNSPQVAIFAHTSNNILITNNKTNMTKASSGIGVWWSDKVLVSNNKVENSHLLSQPQGGHEESISIAGTTNFEVSYNEIFMSNGNLGYLGNEAVDCKDGTRFGTIHHNYIHDYGNEDGGGIYIDAWEHLTGNIDIYNNYVSNSGGITVGSERGGTAENVRIYNNIVYNTRSTGIAVPARDTYNTGIRRNIEIYNNTIYKVKYNGGAGIYVTAPFIENIVIRNNVVYMNNWNGSITAASSALLPYIKANNNLVYGSKNCSQAYPNCVEISNNPTGYPDIYGNVTADPKFMSLTVPDFHLQSSSPAINFGVSIPLVTTDYDGKSRPQGSAYDAGAFEYQLSSPPTLTVTPTRTPTSTVTPTRIPTLTVTPTKTPTPVLPQECIPVVFSDGVKVTICK